MDYNYYLTLIGEYINTGRSQERFCAEIGYPEDAPSEKNFMKAMSIIAAAADGDMKRLVELTGMKLTSFTRNFNIPYRTAQKWLIDTKDGHTPPPYLPLLIGYALVSEVWQDAV